MIAEQEEHAERVGPNKMKLPSHPVSMGQARQGFPGTKWRAGCEQRKYLLKGAPRARRQGRVRGDLAGHHAGHGYPEA
jgi:hypothetical protein